MVFLIVTSSQNLIKVLFNLGLDVSVKKDGLSNVKTSHRLSRTIIRTSDIFDAESPK